MPLPALLLTRMRAGALTVCVLRCRCWGFLCDGGDSRLHLAWRAGRAERAEGIPMAARQGGHSSPCAGARR